MIQQAYKRQVALLLKGALTTAPKVRGQGLETSCFLSTFETLVPL